MATSPGDAPQTRVSEAPATPIQVLLLVAASFTVLAGAIVVPTLPSIRDAYPTYPNIDLLARLVVSLPPLFIALASPLVGWVIDRHGRKPMLVAGLLAYALFGTTGAYLDNLWGLLAGRAALGIAVAGVMTTTQTLVADFFSPAGRNRYLGYQTGVMAGGGMLYISLGGVLADIDWRYTFWVYALSLTMVPFVLRLLPEPTPSQRAGGPLQTTPSAAATFRPREAIGLLILAFLGMVLFYLIVVQIPFLLEAERFGGVTGTETSLAIAVGTLVGALIALTYSRLRRTLSYTGLFVVFFGMMGTGYALVATASTYYDVMLGIGLSGLGFGLLTPNSTSMMMLLVPPRLRGRYMGGLTMAFFLGQFSSPLVVQPLAATGGPALAFEYAALFSAGTALTLLIYGAGARRLFA